MDATTTEVYLELAERGAFDDVCGKVELVGGRITIVNKGCWHGCVEANVFDLVSPILKAAGFRSVTSPSVPMSPIDVTDPDLVWVRSDARPEPGWEGRRIKALPADSFGLIVEVGDTTERIDLGVKAEAAAAFGIEHYWVVTRNGVTVFGQPSADGYGTRTDYGGGESVPVPHTDASVSVDDLLTVPDWAA
jgi:Uma2 family endonuclease